MAMGQEFAAGATRFADETVDPAELADIVREACEARNGWKVILRRCAAPRRTSRRDTRLLEAYLDQKSLTEVALHLAEAPCGPLGMKRPRDATLALFSTPTLRLVKDG